MTTYVEPEHLLPLADRLLVATEAISATADDGLVASMAGFLAWAGRFQAMAVQLAEIADECQQFAEQFHHPITARQCRRAWDGLLEKSALESLRPAENGRDESAKRERSGVRHAWRLRDQLTSPLADVATSVAELTQLFRSLEEPLVPAEAGPLLPASLIDLPDALAHQIAARVRELASGVRRIHLLCERIMHTVLQAASAASKSR